MPVQQYRARAILLNSVSGLWRSGLLRQLRELVTGWDGDVDGLVGAVVAALETRRLCMFEGPRREVWSTAPDAGSAPIFDEAEESEEVFEQNTFVEYRVVVEVRTRAGDIPVSGVQVRINDQLIGTTGQDGQAPSTGPRGDVALDVELRYENSSARLKRERVTLSITGIDPNTNALSAGQVEHTISKIQDVFGSGAEGFGGDLDFTDTYAGADRVTMENTDDPNLRLMKVNLRVATLSLQVPYLSQVGAGETITIAAAKNGQPAQTQTFRGSIICMPTSTKMCIDYWQITKADGADLSRNDIMQECWDQHSNPSTNYPCPWQEWWHLRAVAGNLAANDPDTDTFTVTDGPAGQGSSASIPSAYANAIVAELSAGKPVVTSTYATNGHVMCVRGAVVDHAGQAQWLIFNDPYGNLAAADSVYDRLDLSAPVGLRGTSTVTVMNLANEVRAVQEILIRLGDYAGPANGLLDETNTNDPTVAAIRQFQSGFTANPDGRVDPNGASEARLNQQLAQGTGPTYKTAENERNAANGAGSDRGRHVYYNGGTEAAGVGGIHRFRLKTEAWTLVIEKTPALTVDEVRARLTPGQ